VRAAAGGALGLPVRASSLSTSSEQSAATKIEDFIQPPAGHQMAYGHAKPNCVVVIEKGSHQQPLQGGAAVEGLAHVRDAA